MTFVKGQVGNPLGRRAEKPFADALRLEIAAAGENQRALRAIARNLLRMAQLKKGMAALPAIVALADRLDGRPSQESVVATIKHDASDWSREELVAIIEAGGGRAISQANGSIPALPAPPTFQTRHCRG